MGVELFNVDSTHPFAQRMDKIDRDRERARLRAARLRRRLQRRTSAIQDGVPVHDTSSDDDDDDDDDEVANVNFGDYSGVKGTGAGPKGGKKKSKKKGLKCTQYEEKMIVNILGKPVWEVHEAHSAHKTLKEVHKRLGGDDKPFQPTPKTFKRPPDPPDGAGDDVGVVPPGPTQAETFSETEPPPTDAPPQPQPEAPPQDEAVPPESAEDDFM